METTVNINGTDIRIRSLTWGEKEQLEAEGVNFSTKDSEEIGTVVKKVVRICVLNPESLKDLAVYEVYDLYADHIMRISFLGDKQLKNSDGPQP